MTRMELSRRKFLVSAAAVGGGLVLGLSWQAHAAVPAGTQPWYGATPPEGAEMNAWIVIGADNSVLIRVAQSEMGQGVMTALPMIVAEELDCAWENVKVEYASANRSLREGNVYQSMSTGGSSAVRNSRPYLQQAGASARERLKGAAAALWSVPVAELTTSNGTVTHSGSARTATYGELAAAAATVELAEEPAIKTPDQFKLIGQPLIRLDQKAKVNGTAVYGLDVKVPNMVYAATAVAPVMGGTVVSFDADSIRGLPGVVAVIEFGRGVNNPLGLRNGVAVVADTYWRARSALAQLRIEWDLGPGAAISSASLRAGDIEALDAAEPGGVAEGGAGDVPAAFAAAGEAGIITADYAAPYQSHATMEPLNCTAQVTADRVDIWMGTQDPPGVLAQAAEVSGVAPENVYVHTCFLGGGFGGRIRPEAAATVAIAKELNGRPVKVVWSREDDMARDWFDPRAVSRFKATLGADGLPTALYNRLVGDSIFGWIAPQFIPTGVDFIALWGINNMPYLIPNKQFEFTMRQSHHPVHFMRAPGHNHNTFMIEGFVDELAEAAGQDPVEYRRQLLRDLPEWLNVLNAGVSNSNWGAPVYPGFGRGVGLGEAFGTIVCCVAEVSVSRRGEVVVERIDAAIDCGNVVNPLTVAAQSESCVIYGLSSAMLGEITFQNGQVQQRNFDTYQVLRMADMPVVNTHLVPRGGDHWGGIGEVVLGPSIAAVVNAVHAATGKRVRSLPLRSQDLSWS